MSILFIFFLSFFFLSVTHNSKTIRRMQMLYIPNDCSATEHLSFLVWGGVRATTGELLPRNGPRVCKTNVFIDFWGFCLRNPGVARIVRPHPDYWTRVLQCATSLAGNCQQAEVGLYSFLYLLDVEDHLNAMEDAVVHLDTFGSPQRDSAL